MNNDTLIQRQRWFRLFPEGSIEFLVATRVLAMILLLALLIVGKVQIQLLASLVALTGVLWLDYVLVVWWAVQLVIDLEEIRSDRPATADVQRRRRIRAGLLICLPSVVAAVLIAPWPAMLRLSLAGLLPGDSIIMALRGVAVLLFIVLVILAQRTMQRIGLGSSVWTLLLMIPFVHWFALHRLIGGLYRRLAECEAAASAEDKGNADDAAGFVVAIADVTWVLAILPWGILTVIMLAGGGWPTEFPQALLPFCGVPLTAIFAVTDLAALESVQKRFVDTLRKR